MSALICLLFVPQLALPPAAQAEADDGSAPGNLVLNGGFEETQEGAAGWLNGIQPSHWGHWIAAGTPMLAVDEEIKRSGERSVRLEGPAGTTSRAAVSQPIPVEVGKTYRISGWVRTQEVSNAALIRFQMRREGTSNLLIHVGTLSGTNDWTYMERLLTVPDNAALPARLAIEMFLETGSGKVWFDLRSAIETGFA